MLFYSQERTVMEIISKSISQVGVPLELLATHADIIGYGNIGAAQYLSVSGPTNKNGP